VSTIFDKYPDAAQGKFLYMRAQMQTSTNPDEHLMYIEAAVKCDNKDEVERMTRESAVYDPKQVRDFLMSQKEFLSKDPRPLINVCHKHNFVTDLIKYFYQQNQMKFIENYALQVNPSSIPEVCGALLDLQSGEDFIKTLILAGAQNVPAEELMKQMECRNRLKMILPWLEARVNEGSTDNGVHTALAKIYIDVNNNPERYLKEDNFYNCMDIGVYCETRNPNLAIIAYTKGGCDVQVIACTTKNNMFKEQARFLLNKMNEDLWKTSGVLSEANESPRALSTSWWAPSSPSARRRTRSPSWSRCSWRLTCLSS